MIKSNEFENLQEALSLLSEELESDSLLCDMEIEVCKGDGLRISRCGNQAFLYCRERIQVFRALGLLAQRIKEGAGDFELEEEIQFNHNGMMFDVSRNAVLKVETIKKLLRYMAVMGLNTALLYMEDVYEVKEYPYFGYMRGRYTFEELRECDQYAQQLGIEMVPCIQTLGHLDTVLRWNYARDIKDTDNVLMVGEEKTYRFIEAMIQAATAPFHTNKIHVGMDEAWGLGTGAYQRKNGHHDSFEIMEQHLNRVIDIVRKQGKEPMIWSDMFFRLGSKTHDYYDPESEFPASLREKIPEGLGLVYWDYYHTKPEEYELYLKKHQQLGEKIIFAGGIWIWYGMGPKNNHTTVSTESGLEICKKHGIQEVFATLWGDNGAEVNILTALYGMQQYAEHTYHRNPSEEEIRRRFAFCVKEDADAYLALSKIDEWTDESMRQQQEDCSNPSKWILWQDILCGLFDHNLQGLHLKEYYKELEAAYQTSKSASKHFGMVYEFYEKLCSVLAVKWNLGIRIKKYYDAEDKNALRNIVSSELQDLKRKVQQLREAHRALWFTTNKSFGFDVLDIRYGGLLNRVDTAEYILKEYINGTVKQIEELEQERLPYGDYKFPTEPFYHRIATVAPII